MSSLGWGLIAFGLGICAVMASARGQSVEPVSTTGFVAIAEGRASYSTAANEASLKSAEAAGISECEKVSKACFVVSRSAKIVRTDYEKVFEDGAGEFQGLAAIRSSVTTRTYFNSVAQVLVLGIR